MENTKPMTIGDIVFAHIRKDRYAAYCSECYDDTPHTKEEGCIYCGTPEGMSEDMSEDMSE